MSLSIQFEHDLVSVEYTGIPGIHLSMLSFPSDAIVLQFDH